MKKLYKKSELAFSLICITLYVVLFSIADNISDAAGTSKIVTAPLCVISTAILYFWIRKNNLSEKYGLCKAKFDKKQFLFFIPLILLASTNVWWGVKLNETIVETILYVISMLCVGFMEEIIFRGFLFKAMYKNNVKSAIIVSSVTFGIGHIVNLMNGKEIFETLMQVCYAIAIGFLFTIIFYKGKSLWPCIITHSVTNSLSIFANAEKKPVWGDIICAAFLCIVSLAYALYIIKNKNIKE